MLGEFSWSTTMRRRVSCSRTFSRSSDTPSRPPTTGPTPCHGSRFSPRSSLLSRSPVGEGVRGSACLLKPLDLDDLAAVVERLTDGTHDCGLVDAQTPQGT